MPVDFSFPFYLMGNWTNDYFCLPDWNTIDSSHNTIKFYSFNGENCSHPLPELDLFHVDLHWNLRCYTANSYVCEMMTDKEGIYIKEYVIDNTKVSGIVSREKGFNIYFQVLVRMVFTFDLRDWC
jgi:hypothetical protein